MNATHDPREEAVMAVLPLLKAHFQSVVCEDRFPNRDIWVNARPVTTPFEGENFYVSLSIGPEWDSQMYLLWVGSDFVRFKTFPRSSGPKSIEGEIRLRRRQEAA